MRNLASGPNGQGTPPPEATPPPGALDALVNDCMTNINYNACIFLKNPVAQKGSIFSPVSTYATDLSAIQIYGVNLYGMTSPGVLANSSFNVIVGGGLARATPDALGNWKYTYANDPNHRVAQIMAYHWLTKQLTFMTQTVGNFFATGKNISVNAFETADPDAQNNAYWDYTTNKVVMGVFSNPATGTVEAALSAEIYAHEMGHANRSFANSNANGASTSTHTLCGPTIGGQQVNLCCKTLDGCLVAIDEGQADYHAAILFPNSPTLGESVKNNMSGLSGCTSFRNPNVNGSLTSSTAYNSCPTNTSPAWSLKGEVHTMGMVYVAAWWQIRNQASNKTEIDKLFNEHLKVLALSETFKTILPKITSLDQSLFAGRNTSLITTTFANHGISP